MSEASGLKGIIVRNWFYAFFAANALAAWVLFDHLRLPLGVRGQEALVAWVICALPATYVITHRRRERTMVLVIRTIGFASLGLLILGVVVPAEDRSVIDLFHWPRLAGVALLVAYEFFAAIRTLTLVLKGGPERVTAKQVGDATGMPHFAAWFVLKETQFWRWVWRQLPRRASDKSSTNRARPSRSAGHGPHERD